MSNMRQIKLFHIIFLTSWATVLCQKNICDICTCDGKSTKINVDCQHCEVEFYNETSFWTKNNQTVDILSLNLQENFITHITPFPKLNLTKLNLSNNQIARIDPKSFLNLSNLTELDLSFNELVSENLLPEIFESRYDPTEWEPIKTLKILRLSGNALHTLHPNLFAHLTHLEVLSLDGNPFNTIDKLTELAILSISYLKVLDLSRTNLRTLPQHMLHTPKFLTVLNLTGNAFEQLPETLGDAHNLEWLSISENPIESFEGKNRFPKISTLKVLEITNMNKLKKIGAGAFSGLTGLTELICNYNEKLEWLDHEAFSWINETTGKREWPHLQKIILSYNSLSTIKNETFANWNSIKTLDISENSFVCDCTNQWMVDTLITEVLSRDKKIANDVRCRTPPELEDKTLIELRDEQTQMRCVDAYGNRPENDGTILVGILVGVLLALPIALGILLICHRKNFFGMISPRGPADFSRAFYKRTVNDDF